MTPRRKQILYNVVFNPAAIEWRFDQYLSNQVGEDLLLQDVYSPFLDNKGIVSTVGMMTRAGWLQFDPVHKILEITDMGMDALLDPDHEGITW